LTGVRDQAYRRIVAAYRPNVGVEYLRECLHFEDLEEARRFLRQSGAVFVREEAVTAGEGDGSGAVTSRHRGGGGGTKPPPFWVDCKASASALRVSSASEGQSAENF
jgi:hypothetical protein